MNFVIEGLNICVIGGEFEGQFGAEWRQRVNLVSGGEIFVF